MILPNLLAIPEIVHQSPYCLEKQNKTFPVYSHGMPSLAWLGQWSCWLSSAVDSSKALWALQIENDHKTDGRRLSSSNVRPFPLGQSLRFQNDRNLPTRGAPPKHRMEMSSSPQLPPTMSKSSEVEPLFSSRAAWLLASSLTFLSQLPLPCNRENNICLYRFGEE